MRLLTLEEAVEVVPLSKTTLYRVAKRGGGPFLKVEGRWIVYEEQLHAWVQSHATDGPRDPMPRRPGTDYDAVLAEIGDGQG